jgi:creatinine amidohydrolase
MSRDTGPSPESRASSPWASRYDLARLTSREFARLLADTRRFVVLVPVGSVEPHGPHLSLLTDTVISRGAAERAAARLERTGMIARIAPAVPYGVTDCASAFPGAVSLPADVLTAYLRAVVAGFLASGVDHVCLVNNHLEPAHDQAVRDAVQDLDRGLASVACPLIRRWARTLSAEFKSGACHAGQYETSIMMAEAPGLVNEDVRAGLAEVAISLSDNLRAGVSDFLLMGLREAYAGAPAQATVEEGEDMLDRLADMIVTEVRECLGVVMGEA